MNTAPRSRAKLIILPRPPTTFWTSASLSPRRAYEYRLGC